MHYHELIFKFKENEKQLRLSRLSALIYLHLRFYLFRAVQKRDCGVSNKNARDFRLNKETIFLEIVSSLVFMIKLPVFMLRGCGAVFAEHGRYQVYNDKKVDPYTFLSQAEYKRTETTFCRVGSLVNGVKDVDVFNLNYLFISQIQLKFISLLFSLLLFPPVLILYIYTRRVFSVTSYFSDGQILGRRFFIKFMFAFGQNIASILLVLFIRPKKIKVVDAYNSNGSFVTAGNILGIDTYEYQHGMVSAEHIAYDMNLHNTNAGKYFFPKNLLMWSSAWGELIPLVSKGYVKGVEWTYEYFHATQNDVISFEDADVDVLIIGQPSIQSALLDITNKITSSMNGVNVVYRPHPKEDGAKIPPKLKLDSSRNLYESLGRSKVIVGGFSTVLLEARSLGIDVISVSSAVPDEYKRVLSYFGVSFCDSVELVAAKIEQTLATDKSTIRRQSPINRKVAFSL